jgi:hypothetical protein
VQVLTLRVPDELLRRLDAYTARVQAAQPYLRLSRAEVLRILLDEGLRRNATRDQGPCAAPANRRAPSLGRLAQNAPALRAAAAAQCNATLRAELSPSPHPDSASNKVAVEGKSHGL